MSSQQSLQTPPARALPDVNAETNPFELVQQLLDEAAYFNLYVGVESRQAHSWRSRDVFDIEGGFTLNPGGRLRQLHAVMAATQISQRVGAPIGTFRSRWMFAPDDFEWSPGKEPPAVLFDPERSQRLVMQESDFVFDSGSGSFRGYGLGQTYPVVVGGSRQREVLVGGVGNVTAGTANFAGAAGTFVLNGRITRELGFQGNVTVRVMDPNKLLHDAPSPAQLVPPSSTAHGDEATYIVMRGQKKDKHALSLYSYAGEDPIPIGLETPAELYSAEYCASARGADGLRTQLRVGDPIGNLDATIMFNIADAPGTATRPNAFCTRNTYRFTDDRRRVVGSIRANVELGRTFDLRFAAAPRQAGLRYGGIGPIVGSSGIFANAQGMVAVNSVVGLAPHALSMLNVLRIVDRDGTFRKRIPG